MIGIGSKTYEGPVVTLSGFCHWWTETKAQFNSRSDVAWTGMQLIYVSYPSSPCLY
jgi:hypothetical protein